MEEVRTNEKASEALTLVEGIAAETSTPLNPPSNLSPDSGKALYEDTAMFAKESKASKIAAEEVVADEASPVPPNTTDSFVNESFALTSMPMISVSTYINDSIATSPTDFMAFKITLSAVIMFSKAVSSLSGFRPGSIPAFPKRESSNEFSVMTDTLASGLINAKVCN